jgi:hypothetical protein
MGVASTNLERNVDVVYPGRQQWKAPMSRIMARIGYMGQLAHLAD